MIKKWLKVHPSALFAIMLGLMLVLAFAPFEIFPLAIIAPAGLLALILHATPKRAAWLGFLFGIGLFGAGVYWIYISIHTYGDVPSILAYLITAALICILALFPASVCYLVTRYFPGQSTTKLVCAFPAVWLAIEWVRSWIACGFPWLFLGYSQTNSPLRGFAPILSVYGISLVVLITSGLLVSAVLKYRAGELRSLYYNLLSIAAIWITGALLSLIPWTESSHAPLTVSLVQGNIPQSLKWSPEHVNLSFDRYREMTEPLWGKSELIVWPEAAIPMTLDNASNFIDDMDDLARKNGSHLILGIPIDNPRGEGYFNALISLGKDRTFYFKRLLVPYGEYVPFQQLSSRVLSFMDVPMANMVPGSYSQKPMNVGGIKINTSICFEIAFPDLIRTSDSNVGMLLTVTNDAWFGKSTAQAQHLQMAKMRALELGRPVLFASNDGITAIIGPHGQVEASAPQHVPYVLTGKVQPMTGLTPWMMNGFDPILVIMFSLIFIARRSTKKSSDTILNGAKASSLI